MLGRAKQNENCKTRKNEEENYLISFARDKQREGGKEENGSDGGREGGRRLREARQG